MKINTKARPHKERSKRETRAGSLSQSAYQQIRDEILRGDLSTGDLLSRRRLAERLEMSFLPITEALQRLEAEGLVESKPRIGTRVRIPTRLDVLNSYVIREALEVQAARLCAEQMNATERKRLLTDARRLDKLQLKCQTNTIDSEFMFSVHTLHMQFHMRIAELSRCPGLRIAIEKEQILVFNWFYDISARRQSLPPEFHHKLATALVSGEILLADREMRSHVRYGLEEVLDWVETSNQGDKWRQRNGKK
jgi:DNA-binding GntR family transcriptional regulator